MSRQRFSTATLAAVWLAAAPIAGAVDPWDFVASPNAGSFTNQLFDADASSPQDIWAVGGSTFGPNTEPLLLRWDGSAWTQQDVGDFPAPAALAAVHALAPDDVWAVGYTLGGTGFVTVVAHFDGSGWTATDIPSTGLGIEHSLQAVHGLASDDVWATGYVNDGLGSFYPLAAHWDGSDWSSEILPQSGFGCETWDVTVIADDDVWAVGQCDTADAGNQPYAVHWDGSSWTPAEMPLMVDGHARLEGVAARGADDVWAVGTDGDADGVPAPLVMHYDGISWQAVGMQPSGGSHEWFHGMAAVDGGGLWGVGQYYDGSKTATLTASSLGAGADLNGDSIVGIDDFLQLLAAWGPCGGCVEDIDHDGTVGISDLLTLLAEWS